MPYNTASVCFGKPILILLFADNQSSFTLSRVVYSMSLANNIVNNTKELWQEAETNACGKRKYMINS